MRDSFVFYRTFYDSVKDLDVEVRDEFFRACFEYSFYDNDISGEISPYAAALFTMAQRNIDESMKRYDTSRIHAENGKLGGRPKSDARTHPENQIKTKSKPNGNQTETKSKPNANQIETKRKPNETLNVNVDVDVDVDENVNVDDDENENDMSLTSTSNRETESKEGVGGNLDETGMLTISRASPQVPDENAMHAFMDKYNIEFDNYNADFSGMDFDLLSHAYSKSPEFLQVDEQARWMSWVCRHYREIVRGYYDKRFAPKKAGEEVDDILTAMLAEDYAKEGKNGRG